jgi:hypothetical protein
VPSPLGVQFWPPSGPQPLNNLTHLRHERDKKLLQKQYDRRALSYYRAWGRRQVMSTLVAHRVRHASIRIGSIAAMLTFVILGGGDLFVQWIAGYASPAFMLGTLLINAGLCLGIFVIIAGIGWALSSGLSLTPASTGGAVAIAEPRPQLPGQTTTGMARQVPVPAGSAFGLAPGATRQPS